MSQIISFNAKMIEIPDKPNPMKNMARDIFTRDMFFYIITAMFLLGFTVWCGYNVFHGPSILIGVSSIPVSVGILFLVYLKICIHCMRERRQNLNMRVGFLIGSLSYMLCIIFYFAFVYVTLGIFGDKQELAHDPYISIYFSVITWTTVGYGDFIPSPQTRLYAAVEALLGYIFMVMFISTFIHVFSRVRLSNRD